MWLSLPSSSGHSGWRGQACHLPKYIRLQVVATRLLTVAHAQVLRIVTKTATVLSCSRQDSTGLKGDSLARPSKRTTCLQSHWFRLQTNRPREQYDPALHNKTESMYMRTAPGQLPDTPNVLTTHLSKNKQQSPLCPTGMLASKGSKNAHTHHPYHALMSARKARHSSSVGLQQKTRMMET